MAGLEIRRPIDGLSCGRLRADPRRRLLRGAKLRGAGMKGAIDCDVHPAVPAIDALLPYLDDLWADHVRERGIESLDNASYPPNSPSVRHDWRGENGLAATDAKTLARDILDPTENPHGDPQLPRRRSVAAQRRFRPRATRAVNDWVKQRVARQIPGCAHRSSSRRRTSSLLSRRSNVARRTSVLCR